jgi:allantoinase
MPDSEILYSRNSWVENKLQPASIIIEGSKIAGIEHKRLAGSIDHGEEIIMPGIIDAHVHINEPGRTDWEGFETATKAAAACGITTIIDMPLNSSPVTVDVNALQQKMKASENHLHVNVGFYGGLIPANAEHLEKLLSSGILGIKCFLTHSGIDEFPNVMQSDLEKAMPVISSAGIPLLAHCELTDDFEHSMLAANPRSYLEYLKSRPDIWETKAVSLMVRLSQKFNCKVHIVHVSSEQSLQIIKDAKKESSLVTAETCPHYLLFNAEDIKDGETKFKCAPPIRTAQNNFSLKNAFGDMILDFISSDHSPAPADLKEFTSGNFQKAWGGISGLQFLLPASWTALKTEISVHEFIPLLTTAPAKFLGIENHKGEIRQGYDADLVIWDPMKKFFVTKEEILHRHKESPYLGIEMYGKTSHTYVNGIEVYRNDKIINQNKGQWLLKK